MSIPEVFLNNALVKGKPDNIEALRYDLLNCETDEFEEAYWQIENIPIKDETSGNGYLYAFYRKHQTLEVLGKMK